jgi:hypothetical protein
LPPTFENRHVSSESLLPARCLWQLFETIRDQVCQAVNGVLAVSEASGLKPGPDCQ